MQIDRAATSTLAASASYARFQNSLSKAIVSIRKPIETFSTGGQFVAGRCLYSNEVNNVKDLFLLCEASALFRQVPGPLLDADSFWTELLEGRLLPGITLGAYPLEFASFCDWTVEPWTLFKVQLTQTPCLFLGR